MRLKIVSEGTGQTTRILVVNDATGKEYVLDGCVAASWSVNVSGMSHACISIDDVEIDATLPLDDKIRLLTREDGTAHYVERVHV